jgi:hypothetical protein
MREIPLLSQEGGPKGRGGSKVVILKVVALEPPLARPLRGRAALLT